MTTTILPPPLPWKRESRSEVSDQRARFALRLAKALHEHGAPSDRVEEAMGSLCRRLGVRGQCFATPTAIFASFDIDREPSTHLLRVEPGEVDLGRLQELDELLDAVGGPEWHLERCDLELGRILAPRSTPGGGLLSFSAPILVSLSSCRLLGGGLVEVGVAGLIGVLIAVLVRVLRRSRNAPRLLEPLASFAAAFVAGGVAAQVAPLSTGVAILGGLILLLPGLTLTVAMTEVTNGQLVAGTSRLTGAAVLFLGIGFGVLLGTRCAEALFGPPGFADPIPLPPWSEWVALGISPGAFCVLFRARFRDLVWITPSVVGAFVVARFGAAFGGPEVGVFLGALFVGLGSNLYARWFRRSPSVPQVPGILILVPGSIGFHSLSSLLKKDVISGLELGFTMALVAVALVAGLLLANAMFPPRKMA